MGIRIYEGFIGSMISTSIEADIFWFTCILVLVITGITMVLAGCCENKAVQKSNIYKK